MHHEMFVLRSVLQLKANETDSFTPDPDTEVDVASTGDDYCVAGFVLLLLGLACGSSHCI